MTDCREQAAREEPDFLRRQVDEYYGVRQAKWADGQHILVGSQPQDDAVLMMSNDYLGISTHPELQKGREAIASDDHLSLVMAAVFLGSDSLQARFESEMATFMGSEGAVLAQSGWNANVGLIQAIAKPDTPVYIDTFAHMSLWEGIKSARAQCIRFKHNDVAHLERQIRRAGPGFIIVDSVYSTSGNVAPLKELAAVAKAQGCVLIVDESHSLGTHGPNGRGLVVQEGLEDDVHFRTASLAKAFAGRAGIVACSSRCAEFVKYRSNPAIFSSGLLNHEIEMLRTTLRAIHGADDRRERLMANTQRMREALADLNLGVTTHGEQIIGLVAGEERNTMRLRDYLEAQGLFGSVFCAPATPQDGSLVRLTLNSEISESDMQRAIEICQSIPGALDVSGWPCRQSDSPRRKMKRAQTLRLMAAA